MKEIGLRYKLLFNNFGTWFYLLTFLIIGSIFLDTNKMITDICSLGMSLTITSPIISVLLEDYFNRAKRRLHNEP